MVIYIVTGKLHHHRRQVTPQETFKTSPSSHFLSSGSVRVYSKLKQNASLESEMASGKNNVEVLPQIEKVCVPFADAAHQATESSSATSVALSTVLTSFDECKVVGAEGSEQAYVPDTNLVPLHAIAVASLKDGEDDNEFIAMEDKEALAAMIECTSEPLKTVVTEKSLGAAELRHDDSSYCVTVSSHGPMDIAEEHSYSYRQGIIAIKPIKHIKEPPEYACLLCPFKTRHRSSFRSHHLLHTGEKPHKCEVCGRAFRLSYSLLQHMRTHTGERPYHCYVCDRRFTVHCTWRIHMRKHTGERPYRCEICNKAFVTLYTLKKHSHLHSREKP